MVADMLQPLDFISDDITTYWPQEWGKFWMVTLSLGTIVKVPRGRSFIILSLP